MTFFSPKSYFDLTGYAHRELFEGVTHVWDALGALKEYLRKLPLGKIEVVIPEGVTLVDAHLISIGQGTVVEPGAYIKGPCVIGKNCSVRHTAYLRGDILTGDNCVLGHASEFKGAILLNGAHAAHFAYVGDSILGNGVNLGAGTRCANLRYDGRPIIVHNNGERLATGLRKFGAILGDRVQTGCNSVLNPGTLVGKDGVIYPCVNVGGVITAGAVKK